MSEQDGTLFLVGPLGNGKEIPFHVVMIFMYARTRPPMPCQRGLVVVPLPNPPSPLSLALEGRQGQARNVGLGRDTPPYWAATGPIRREAAAWMDAKFTDSFPFPPFQIVLEASKMPCRRNMQRLDPIKASGRRSARISGVFVTAWPTLLDAWNRCCG